MHLRSLTLKGFKSFPDRTQLEFGPGVSVVVGPNGSGKSNIAEAALWALGEQSPTAVRGQNMQDVIFAGGHGVGSRSSAEVEVVLDNADGAAGGAGGPGGFSEISIVRHLDRSGEGGYRLNGARCRLIDVAEVLSDTGLGREMHSVVSQGKVDAIVHSRPRERRLLIEEAAGLGKHRRRRRRAELKLGHTRENLERALDVEREARSGLRSLKRQAEAAELHERLERQSLEARIELVRDDLRSAERERVEAEAGARAARGERDALDRHLTEVAERREAAEAEFAAHARGREELSERVHAARSARDRIGLRAERARDAARAAAEDAERRHAELERLDREDEADGSADARAAGGEPERVRTLEAELAELWELAEERRAAELVELEHELAATERRRAAAEEEAARHRARVEELERAAAAARAAQREAERAVESARARAATAGAELASVDAYLRAAGGMAGGAAEAFADGLEVKPGYEVALAAVLGPRIRAAVVGDLAAGEAVLARGGEGASALLAADLDRRAPDERGVRSHEPPPAPGADLLLDHVHPGPGRAELAQRLLDDVWVVSALSNLEPGFSGIAVTREGRVLDARVGELRQAAAGGDGRLLEERNRREQLVAASEAAAAGEAGARAEVERVRERVAAADREREAADVTRREAERALEDAAETARWTSERMRRRRGALDEEPEADRRAALEAELRAERRLAERLERERAERAARRERLRTRIGRDKALARASERAAETLASAEAAVAARRDALTTELDAGALRGERTAAELRACAREETELQGRLRAAGEAVTTAEVSAERARDRVRERAAELAEISAHLGVARGDRDAAPRPEPLPDDRRAELEARVERVRRRREQLGPVNPLAGQAYTDALAHVEELESQRADLETALSELESLIREIDRRIRESFEETFAAAARNFEEVVTHLFSGGRGRLRLVHPEHPGPHGAVTRAGEVDHEEREPYSDPDGEDAPSPQEPGVEVEVTPAGKATRRLSLLSGGEKSLVALAFLFAVFLARPCPFYILDEVEAALDDLNIDRFLELLRRYSDRAQFIVVTHQRRTMDAADRVYGVSMGRDGVSKVVSRRLRGRAGAAPSDEAGDPHAGEQPGGRDPAPTPEAKAEAPAGARRAA